MITLAPNKASSSRLLYRKNTIHISLLIQPCKYTLPRDESCFSSEQAQRGERRHVALCLDPGPGPRVVLFCTSCRSCRKHAEHFPVPKVLSSEIKFVEGKGLISSGRDSVQSLEGTDKFLNLAAKRS